MRLLLAFLVAALLAGPALAQDARFVAPGDGLPGSVPGTYADLIRSVAPDLTETDGLLAGHLSVPVRHLFYPEDAPVEQMAISFRDIAALTFRGAEGERLALLIPGDAEILPRPQVLVVFDLNHLDRPVDLADIATDQSSGFHSPATLPLGRSGDGVLVASYHHNSSQGYRSIGLVALVDGELRAVASVFTLNENHCLAVIEQAASFGPSDQQDQAWAPFTATIVETTRPTPEGCEEAGAASPGVRSVEATYQWDVSAGAYRPATDALEVFMRETESRF